MIIVLFVLIAYAIGFMMGIHRGVMYNGLHLLTTLISIYFARLWYQSLGPKLNLVLPYPATKAYDMHFFIDIYDREHRFDAFVTFILIFLLSKLTFYMIISVFERKRYQRRISRLSRLLGAIIGVIPITIYIQFTLICMTLYPHNMFQNALIHSKIAQFYVWITPIYTFFL
ncbi:CvpA family protein [Staphylococcus massiliensis CCUG 55927]|uniref:Colicin V production protein n=1 Tax=Staphylococcus massiliensis S46 TaxID=1229783 RepID=K9AFX5_9STAP|nr:hypothetical protein C273_09839 [Staphylococcus massiliensis S46]POA01736.1 CvpA family protein [Staphylococcus massiliensis CCUG 55927]